METIKVNAKFGRTDKLRFITHLASQILYPDLKSSKDSLNIA